MLFGGDNAESYYDEGLTAAMKGDLETAVAHFNRATQLDPTFATAWYQLGRCLLRQGATGEAAAALEKALALSPGMTVARIELGYALFKAGNTDQANRVFAQVLDEKPDTPRAILGLGYCAYQAKNWDTAMALADRAASGTSDRFEALFLSGRAAHMMRLKEAALDRLFAADALIDRLIEASPDQPEGYYLRGQIYFLTGEYAKALEHFNAAMERSQPGRRYAVYNEIFDQVEIIAGQGWCHKQMGDSGAAREAGLRILELKPGSRRGKWLTGEADA